MEKEISLSAGLKLTPYSDVSPDGELALCHGVEVDGTSLRPSLVDGTTTQLAAKLLYVHETYTYKHYILVKENQLQWQNDGETTASDLPSANIGEVKLASVGNVLIGTTDDTMYYWLWNQADSYEFLGHRIPELPIQFRLSLKKSVAPPLDFKNPKFTYNNTTLETDGSYGITGFETGWDRQTFSENLMGIIATMHSDIASQNLFSLPFFVRAAYRTYDGNYIAATPPTLMQPNVQGTRIQIYPGTTSGESTETTIQVPYAQAFSLQYELGTGLADLAKWKDVLKDVCVFVTPAFRCWESGGSVLAIRKSQTNTLKYAKDPTELIKEYIHINDLPDDYGFYVSGYESGSKHSQVSTDQLEILLPFKDAENNLAGYYDEVKEESRFVLLSNMSLPLSDYESKIWLDVPIEDGKVTSLEARAEGDALKETYSNGHYQIGATNQFVYNHRLNLSGVNLDVSDQIPSWVHFPGAVYADTDQKINVVVTLKKGGREYVVKNNDATFRMDQTSNSIYWFFYPDTDATKAVIWLDKNSEGKYLYMSVSLKEHSFLDGAYWFGNFKNVMQEATDTSFVPTLSSDTLYQQGNMLYTSEADNPFLFPASGQNVIGNGDIMTVTAITTPLSQGQFGQYPMIALCSDGNYSLEIGTTGLITSIRPMVRDVCVNKDNVVPIDNALLYVSQRGLVVMSGNEVQCISQELDGVVDSMAQELLKPASSTASSQHRAPSSTQSAILSNTILSEDLLLCSTLTKIWSLAIVKDWEYLFIFDMTAANITKDYSMLIKIGNQTIYSGTGGKTKWSFKFTAETTGDADIYVKCVNTTSMNRETGNVVNNFEEGTYIQFSAYLGDYINPATQDTTEESTEEDAFKYEYDGIIYQKKTEESYTASFDFYSIAPRTFISLCQCVWDYTNQRIILVAKGMDKGYARNMKTGTWSTIPLRDTVQAVMNQYPYSYIQWADNTLTQLDTTYPYDPTQVETGIILTRPLKLDSLQMKKLCEFAIQGILDGSSRVQTITLYGSNDGVSWGDPIGVTTRQRVPHVPGRWYKYWRFKIETSLSQAENISGIRIKYDVRGETRIR